MKLAEINKFLVALLTAGVASLTAAGTTGLFSVETAITVAISVLGAASVYVFPNGQEGWQKYAKSIVVILTAVGTPFVIALVTGTVTQDQLFPAFLQALGALGVYQIPNTASKGE